MTNKTDNRKKKDLFDISTPKELLAALLITGGVLSIMAISPALLATAIPVAQLIKKEDKEKMRKTQKTFSYLRKRKFIAVLNHKGYVKISITKSGKEFIKKHQISTYIVSIPVPNKWDKKWRILFYDVSTADSLKRDALRYFIKKLNMKQMQKSVWIYPFDCSEQVSFLKNFLELTDMEIRLIVTDSIGDDKKFRKIFNI